MKNSYLRTFILLFAVVVLSHATLSAQRTKRPTLEKIIGDSLTVIAHQYAFSDTIKRVAITVNKAERTVIVTANDDFGQQPFRKENVDQIYGLLKRQLSSDYPGYTIVAMAYQKDIRQLIPNYLRPIADSIRYYRANQLSVPAVSELDRPYQLSHGLTNRNIALWHSHGLHNLLNDTVWGWQRPNLFQTVEDLLTTSFVLPFLAPMLENAGARVYIPRERDINPNEVIVDNDKTDRSRYREYNDRYHWKKYIPGFADYKKWYTYQENPFIAGTYVQTKTLTDPYESSRIEWIPDIPEEGMYAVYISFRTVDNSTTDAQYSVHHTGGVTRFSVNQTVNGGTWLYLGHFYFDKGRKADSKVVLTNLSTKNGQIVTADAVKFGGGMGTVTGAKAQLLIDSIPTPFVSGFPRFAEGARYWLQWAGVPDSVYSRTQNTNHYSDDFQSRGHWVNYLQEGLGVPVDLAFAFHTDAGVRTGDSIVGTLGIATITNSIGDTLYKNGTSRWAARDMVDMIQSEIVHSIRSTHRSDWTRRGIWNRSYSESRVPEVPTMLLELLSHQNFEDMKYALDPGFRFTISRAIYKGILKYLAVSNNRDYVVQPLPISHFSSRFITPTVVSLKWKATPDPLEPTAMPSHYRLQTRIDGGGFDNGFMVSSDSIYLTIEPGKIYSFKLSAVNSGGQSFPSEVLSVYKAPHEKGEVLIINGFDRVSGPEHFNLGPVAGFLNDKDAGVPYLYDVGFTGRQHDFSVSSPYKSNRVPGFGASERTHEDLVIRGNTFDFPYLHGQSIRKAGYSFVSTSVAAVRAGDITLEKYRMINFIAGKQKQTILGNVKKAPQFQTFPLDLQRRIRTYTQQGGNLLVSGAYVASDLYHRDAESQQFIEEVLHIQPDTTEYKKYGMVRLDSPADSGLKLQGQLNYHALPNTESYFVEDADVLKPADMNAWVIGWYNGGDQPSMIASKGKNKTIVLGFPFETITDTSHRDKLMLSILQFMFKK
jgi:hypothetical protein